MVYPFQEQRIGELMFEPINPQDISVALLAGGSSGEREISLASGDGAFQALSEAGYRITRLDPARQEDLEHLIGGGFDIAFLCLHGKGGEDGRIQGFLETIGLPYTCSGVWSSSLAMDKGKAKMFYRQAGIPTPSSLVIPRNHSYSVKEIIAQLGDHVVVKAPTEGSTIGIYIVQGADEIEQAIQDVFTIDDQALVEMYVSGTELTVAVLGNEDPIALPIIEIVPKNDFYDFESKYAPGGSEHICPARLTDEQTAYVQDLAIQAHRVLECSGVSRSDFILDEAGTAWLLETNTIPGMTGTSLIPDAARVYGISFPELCTRLIQLGFEAHGRS